MTRAAGLAAVGLSLCLVAAGFASPSLYVPGVALITLSAVAVAWVWLAARHGQVTRVAGAATIEEQAPLALVVTVEHGRVPFPGGELVPWQGGEALPLGRWSPRTVKVQARFERRGRHVLEPARMRVRDPLGLYVREALSPSTELLVLPRVERVDTHEVGGIAGVGRIGRLAASAAAHEIDSLRPYVSGAPASRIHWATVARTGTLMERRLISDADRRPLVVMDPRQPESSEALDRALRAAASLCVHLAGLGGCALLLPGDRRASVIERDLHAWPFLHARLALIEPTDGAPTGRRLERAGAILWVTAGASGPPAGLVRAAARAHYLVTPHPLAGRPIAFTVAGCSGQRLQRAALRSVA